MMLPTPSNLKDRTPTHAVYVLSRNLPSSANRYSNYTTRGHTCWSCCGSVCENADNVFANYPDLVDLTNYPDYLLTPIEPRV